MAVNNLIKRVQSIMRQDTGISGDVQRIEQMVWMFFLKVYDYQEEVWEWNASEEVTTVIYQGKEIRGIAVTRKIPRSQVIVKESL